MSEQEIRVASKTDIGRRTENEDSFLVVTAEELRGRADGLYIVADGMGGRASGAVASRIAVETVRDTFVTSVSDPSEALAECLRAANTAVFREAASRPELQGMGTTCVAAAVRDGYAYFAHLGDSRIYLLRGGRINRLTEDHSFVAEKVRQGEITEDQARRSRFRNVITRAIGLESEVQPSTGSTELQSGDVLLLCSDGLSGPVPDAQIADILWRSLDVDEACGLLVSAALRNGGSDNVTAVVAGFGTARPAPRRHEPVTSKRPVSWIVPALVGMLLGIGVGLYPGYAIFHAKSKAPVKAPVVRSDATLPVYADPMPLAYEPLQPGFLAVDKSGRLHVVDTQGRRMIVDPSGKVLTAFPARDTFKPLKHSPAQMAATDGQGNLYVSDPIGKKILKFGPDGIFVTAIGEGKLISPEALAVDADGGIFVIDNGRLKVIRVKATRYR